VKIILKWTFVNRFQFVQVCDEWQAFILVSPPEQRLLSVSIMFQFCQAIADLPQCSAESQALTVTEIVTPSSISQKVASKPSTQTTIQAACNCPCNRYWKLHQYSNNEFENGTTYTSTIYNCSEVTKASSHII
jgi:hypothetical protein